ncbi:MAG: type II toxin-antitoxin system VapB family antitoxin [Candidatus Sericytochromatia bacterium]|jgi:Arc/MetJ family transcription regulator
MASNLNISDTLLAEALRVSGKKTKKAAVTEALEEYIQRHKQQGLLELFGTLEFDPEYDYKQGRKQR